MILVGVFHVIDGLVALLDNGFYVVTRAYTFQFDTTSWGWIHLILGVVIGFAGWGLLSGRTWARAVAITLAGLSIIANFLFIPLLPVLVDHRDHHRGLRDLGRGHPRP